MPPLNYERVYRLKDANPDLDIVLNGGISEIGHVEDVLRHVDGVMIGRQAYHHHPYFLAELEQHMNPDWKLPEPDRRDVIEHMLPVTSKHELEQGERLGRVTRHMVGLFAGMPGARAWRRYLSEHAFRDGASADVLLEALDAMPVAA